MGKLENHIAVITGASSGIGRAIALGLATQGVALCLVGRNLAALSAVAERAKFWLSPVKIYQVDLNIDGDIQKLKVDLQQDFEHVDILIHSAGVFSMGALESSLVEDFDRQYRINVRAPYLLTQILLPITTR